MQQNASERRGTHATKNRALVSGGGKKPYKQKGTGRPQVGSSRTPLWRKGGTVFGPQPRSYDYDLPKKVRVGALRAALAAKAQDGALIVVDQLASEDRKTKATAELLRRLGATGKTLRDRREARRRVRAVGAQHRGREGRPERARHRARRHGHDPRRRDARGAREAAGGAGLVPA